MSFILHEPVSIEESLTCEFKEVKSQALQSVGKIVDQYVVAFLNAAGGSIFWGIRDTDRVVTGVQASDRTRDELRQVIGQKLASVAPAIRPQLVNVPFHPVNDTSGHRVSDIFVIEVQVSAPRAPSLYLTGAGEAYVRTIGGIKKLSGAELYMALARPLQAKVPKDESASLVSQLPTVHRRASLVRPLIEGRRVLWVDDQPSNNFHERVALGEIGLMCDVATSTEEALRAKAFLSPDVIVSDMHRGDNPEAGLELLHALRHQGDRTPLVFYISHEVKSRGMPPGAFGISDRPDDVLHLVLDVLERTAG